MNRKEYSVDECSVKRVYSKEGTFNTEDGREITYKNWYVMVEVNGTQVLAKVEKGFAELLEQAVVPDFV